jgi:cysteine desulfurase / selenocysteine lyase
MNETIRNQFPILKRTVHNKPLVYLDNAATTQKPVRVIEALDRYYREMNSNIHRGVHFLSQEATDAYEGVRKQVARFINASSTEEIIFTRGTTESINLVASSFGRAFFRPGKEVIISAMEHHSNIVPWQIACENSGATLKVIPVDDRGELKMDAVNSLITESTALIALTHVSNALGTINPVKEIIELAHQRGVPVLLDGAQAIPHLQVDVQALDVDFYCFSSHKMYGPMGIGILYGKASWLDQMPPYQGGGEMIDKVTFEKTTYNLLPFKFEAGTPNVGDAIAFGEAIAMIEEVGYEHIARHENDLLRYTTERLKAFEGIRFIGTAHERAGVVSFLIHHIHPYDLGMILDKFGIAVRTGNHCAQPIMDQFGIPGTVRISFGLYNTREEIDQMADALERAVAMLK